jgi:hypothetical protein
MSVEVAVCYTDLSVVRVPWDEKQNLLLTEVLSIAVLFDGDPQRECRSIGHDFYQLVWTDTQVCLTGHDGDYAWRSFELDRAGDPIKDWIFPFGFRANTIEFVGAYTDNARDWQTALDIFGDPNGLMW